MGGLDRGQEAEGEEAGLVGGVDDLRVLDAEAAAGVLAGLEGRGVCCRWAADREKGGFEGVDGEAVGEVADRVDVDLVAFVGPGGGESREGRGVYEERAGRVGAVGVGRDHGAAPGAEGAVWRGVRVVGE